MKIKTSELTGTALDWAVAKCEGDVWLFEVLDGTSPPGASYSTDWSQGGPIIEREGIATDPNGPYVNGRIVPESWCAEIDGVTSYIEGPTQLIATMRCFVASKLGDEVEVPDEII